jgi:prepilin-type N-terminal cleavage/methylation domain-containing protein
MGPVARRLQALGRARGFTLIELLVAMVVLTILASALAIPLGAQLQARRMEEARRQLDEVRDALLGFAAAQGRLPCPATAASRGEESFAPGGDSANGECASFHDGFVPSATLGLARLDSQGFLRDPWNGDNNRLRYAVAGTTVNGVERAFTRANGMQAATLPALGAASHFLIVCTSGAAANASGCGPAAAQLTRRAVFVLLSLGANAAQAPAAGSDEARNLDGDAVFVSHEPTAAGVGEFDDLVLWTSLPIVTHRMLAAGRLP